MIIGILSDTHGRGENLRAGVEALAREGAEFLVHCGDIGGAGMVDYLVGRPAAFVFGNTDFEKEELRRAARQLGVRCLERFGELDLDGKRVAVLHGDDHVLMQHLLARQEYDYVCYGHTHVYDEQKVGKTWMINPGALYRAREKTVAVVDTGTDGVRRVVVDGV